MTEMEVAGQIFLAIGSLIFIVASFTSFWCGPDERVGRLYRLAAITLLLAIAFFVAP